MFSTSIPARNIIFRIQLPEQDGVAPPTSPIVHGSSRLKDVCALLRIAATASIECETARFAHRRLRRGQRVYAAGLPFDALYVVCRGTLKTVATDAAGQPQILGFPMRGDLLGVDGIYPKMYPTEVVALTSCEVICLPFKQFAALGKAHAGLDGAIYSLMSEDLLREQSLIRILGSFGPEVRVAQFLAWMAKRHADIGHCKAAIVLAMSRHEIGSYLGVCRKTVDRAFSAFAEMGAISVNRRCITIRDLRALMALR